jgi:phosphoglycolate phosphatase
LSIILERFFKKSNLFLACPPRICYDAGAFEINTKRRNAAVCGIKSMKYQLAIFDMDGTILDTLQDLTDSTNVTLLKHGFPTRTIDEVRSFVGNGIHRLIELAVPEGSTGDVVEAVYSDFLPYYQAHCADKTCPYEGIPALIRRLRDAGCKTAVVSNKAHSAVLELCEQYFDGLFDCAVGEQAGMNKKPAPDSVFAVLNALDFQVADAVYIGDSDVDLATARNAGMDCISVTWGFREKAFLQSLGANTFAEKPEDVDALIL